MFETKLGANEFFIQIILKTFKKFNFGNGSLEIHHSYSSTSPNSHCATLHHASP